MHSISFRADKLLHMKDRDDLEDILDTIFTGHVYFMTHQGKQYTLNKEQILFMKHVFPDYIRLHLPKLEQVMQVYELPFADEYTVKYNVDTMLSLYPKLFPLKK